MPRGYSPGGPDMESAPRCPAGHEVDLARGRFCETCGLPAACPNGHLIELSSAVFCETCGVRIVGEAGAAAAAPAQTVAAAGGKAAGSGNRNRLLAFGTVAVLALAAGATAFALSGGDDDPEPPAGLEQTQSSPRTRSAVPSASSSPGVDGSPPGVVESATASIQPQETANANNTVISANPTNGPATQTALVGESRANATQTAGAQSGADGFPTATKPAATQPTAIQPTATRTPTPPANSGGGPAATQTAANATIVSARATQTAASGTIIAATQTGVAAQQTITAANATITAATATAQAGGQISDVYGTITFGGTPCAGCQIRFVGPASLTVTAGDDGYYDTLLYDPILVPGTYNVYYPCAGQLILATPSSVTLAPGENNYLDVEIGFCG